MSSCDNCLDRRQFRRHLFLPAFFFSLDQFLPQNILFAYQAKSSTKKMRTKPEFLPQFVPPTGETKIPFGVFFYGFENI